jgi:hypothetical protein
VRVPIALIHQLCYPTSYRLPKQTRLEVKKPVESPTSPAVCKQTIGYFRNQMGNLHHGDYRFFVGRVQKQESIASCRWCREVLMSQSLRKKHKGNKCQEKLGKVYKEALLAKRCVACGVTTEAQHWGVPLCLGECRDNFKFIMTNPLRMLIDKYKVDHNERLTV